MHVRLQFAFWLRLNVSTPFCRTSQCLLSSLSAVGAGLPLLQGIMEVGMDGCGTCSLIFFPCIADCPILQIACFTSASNHNGSHIEVWRTLLTWRKVFCVLHPRHHKIGIADMHPGLWIVNRNYPQRLWAAQEEAVPGAERVHHSPKPHLQSN